MEKPLRVLIVEDSEADCRLLLRELHKGGFDPQARRVETAKEMTAALADQQWDVIISDYRLPEFAGLEALELVQASGLDLPFIMVSGAVGEEQAVAVMKAGAHDFLPKDHLARLAPTVSRELRDAMSRRHQVQAEAALREREHFLQRIMDVTPGVLHVFDLVEQRSVFLNRTIASTLGFSLDELATMRPSVVATLTHPDDLSRFELHLEHLRGLGDQETADFEHRMRDRAGEWHWFHTREAVFARDPSGAVSQVIGTAVEISERKRAEEALSKSEQSERARRAELETLMDQIRTLNGELESRVAARTAALRDTVEALESEIAKRLRLERGILEISEREQCRLGQDLHDGLGQELAGIAMIGQVFADELAAEGHRLAGKAGKIANYIRDTIESTRQLAKGLYPLALTRYGLVPALEELASQASSRFGINCVLRHRDDAPGLSESSNIHIYRIVQECIGNAIKHGRAANVIVESLSGDGFHTFSVTDDGVGFTQPVDSPGMGLHLIHYRARVIGAQVDIEQPQQGGCRISCRLPA